MYFNQLKLVFLFIFLYNKNMKKLLFLLVLLLPFSVFALDNNADIIFKAKVLNILNQEEKITENGETIIQQNIKLLGLEKDFKEKEVFFYGIGEIELIGSKTYSVGDKVLMVATYNNINDSYNYYIIDYVRNNSLIIIVGLFIIALIFIAGWKGLRSIFSLILSFLIIIYFIIPQIMAGFNPVLISIIGALVILLFIIYLTEGINLRSHLGLISTFISLVLVVFISWFFIFLAKLSGVFSEDVFTLINIGKQSLNFKGMLLAGMIIGSLGVLDDLVMPQVTSVEQIIEANPHQSWQDVFKKAYKVGVSHLSSMTNTLFLAYAGASLPLLILFISPDSPFSSFEQIVNNEAVSTEIVRALSGSLGIILSVPIATFISSWVLVYKKRK